MTISLVFDTETTGVVSKPDPRDPATAAIVQLFAALYEHEEGVSYIEQEEGLAACTARPFAILSTVIDAGVDVPKEAFKVHGISRVRAEKVGVDPINAAHLLEDFIDIADVLVAHNIRYDSGTVGRLLHTAGLNADILGEKQTYCTMRALKPVMKMTPKVYGDWKSPKLIEAYNFVFNRDFEGKAHDASSDSLAAADLYFACLHMGVTDPGA